LQAVLNIKTLTKMWCYVMVYEHVAYYTVSQKTGPLLSFAITPTVLDQ